MVERLSILDEGGGNRDTVCAIARKNGVFVHYTEYEKLENQVVDFESSLETDITEFRAMVNNASSSHNFLMGKLEGLLLAKKRLIQSREWLGDKTPTERK